MNSPQKLTARSFARLAVLGSCLFCLAEAKAQPALLSSTPVNGATGISVNVNTVFTFNTTMDTGVSSATFYYGNNTTVPVTSSWSAGNTILTCTPVEGFPPDTKITWSIIGLSSNNQLITPSPTGHFTTGSGGGTNSLSLSNPNYNDGVFSFTVLTSSNQTVTVEYKTNLTATVWQPLLTTNSPANQFSVSTPSGSNRTMFFRARNGS